MAFSHRKTTCLVEESHNDLPRQRSHTDTAVLQPPSFNRSISAPAHAQETPNIADLLMTKYGSLFPEENLKHHCHVSASIVSKITSTRDSYHQSSGYKNFLVIVTDQSIHFIKQRRMTLKSTPELYRSFPMASVQCMSQSQEEEGEDDIVRITLQLERNIVKLKFTKPEAAARAMEQFTGVHDACKIQLEQERRARQISSMGGSLTGNFSTTLTSPNEATTRQTTGELVGSQSNVIERVLITLRIRPRPVYQPIINRMNVEVLPRNSQWKQLESEKAVIKYPSVDSLFLLPAECYLRMDNSHVTLVWKSPTERHYHLDKCITLDQIYEVRQGQQTEAFKKFPYEETFSRSFSVIYEEQRRVVSLFGSHHYTMLRSIDIICEDKKDCEQWKEALDVCQFDTRKQLYPKNLKFPDHTLVWLKVYFSVYANVCYNEISKEKTIRFFKSLDPTLHHTGISAWYVKAKLCQQHDTVLPDTLNWYGFVATYDLYIKGKSTVLRDLYHKYAKKHPEIGMTVEEFQYFLQHAKNWPEESCTDRKCRKLMDQYDKNHRVYKEIEARHCKKVSPLEMTLWLTFPGFLSFLRGKDCQVITKEHETIYQDMDQPLSHYFINSSHNTYLSGHQIRGESSYEAYIRPLLNGCRCLEIDCWDDGGDIVVTHGNTPTSRVSFSKVLETVKEYAFKTSEYPVILSLENHCCRENRKRMADLFQRTFGSCGFLIREDLDMWQGRSVLPSPKDLQRKVILKDSFKYHASERGNLVLSSPSSSSSPDHLTAPSDSTVNTITSHFNPIVNIETCPMSSLTVADQCEIPLAEYKQSKRPATYNCQSTGQPTEVQDCIVHISEACTPACTPVRHTPDPMDTSVHSDSSPTPDEEELPSWRLNYLLRGTALREYKERLDQRNDDDHVSEKEVAVELSEMVHLRAQKIKAENLWRVMPSLLPSEMLSFQETKAIVRSRENPQTLLNFTRQSFVRVYPKGSRIKSENYDPTIYWNYGMQMVALNYQTSDVFMNINQGKFRQNGNCGYVLKPELLRMSTAEGGLPEPHLLKSSDSAMSVTVKLLGGQNLGYMDCTVASFKLWFLFSGCAEDSCCSLEEFRKCNSSSLEPLFEGTSEEVSFFECKNIREISKEIVVPELCMFYVRLEILERGMLGQRPSPKLFGQNVIPVDSLTQGITLLPLREASGQVIHGSGLFVEIAKRLIRTPRLVRQQHNLYPSIEEIQ